MNRVSVCIVSAALLCAAAAQPPAETTEPCDRSQITVLRRESREAMNARKYDVAVQRLGDARAACPSDRQLLLDLAQAHLARRDFGEALSLAQTFLKGEPASVAGRVMLADAYFMAGRLKEALAAVFVSNI